MDDHYLLDRLRRRHADMDSTNFDVLDFLYTVGSGIDTLMYARLFLPEFCEIDGMVIRRSTDLADNLLTAVRDALRKSGDRAKVEQSFNLLEVTQLLTPGRDDLDERGYFELADVIVQAWRARLVFFYPARRSNAFIADPDDYGGELVVTFSELR